MNSRNENGLFGALEAELRRSKEPLDCNALFDVAAVREHAETVNRVSDYLGNMWRKGQVLRLPAPKIDGARSRWLYVWKNKGATKKPQINLAEAIAYDEHVDQLLKRPGLEITEEGGVVTIMLPAITITIKQR